MTDDQIDTSDIPPLDETFFSQAKLRTPRQVPFTMLVDADLLEWFKAQGEKYESVMNSALRSFVESRQRDQR